MVIVPLDANFYHLQIAGGLPSAPTVSVTLYFIYVLSRSWDDQLFLSECLSQIVNIDQ